MSMKRYVDGERFHAEDYNECLDTVERLEEEVAKKQDKLIVGDGINITDDNVISCTISPEEFIDDNDETTGKTWSSEKINTELNTKQETLVAGSGIEISGNTISATNSGAWGGITGEITAQTDLVEYVDDKISQIVIPESDKEVISILTYSNTAPSNPQENDYYINSSVNKLYQYVNGAWEEREAKDDCLYITEDTQTVYSYSTSTGVFTDITGEPIDNVITITNLNQLDKYKEDAVYTVMYYDEDDDLYVYSFVVDRERKGPPSSPYYEVTQTLRNEYEYIRREGETPLGIIPLEFIWEDWRTNSYAFLPDSFTPGDLVSFGSRWSRKLTDSGKSISDLATKAELNNKQDVLSVGTNITIDSANTINAVGYVYDSTNNSFKEGIYTQVTNDSEHAEGKYNKSNSLGGGSDDYIDLGLPSGTLWCSHNIGATNGNTIDSWRGDFYRCCDIVPFSGRTTKQEYDEYISGKTEEYENPQDNTFYRIKPEYDPATLLMGEEWRLPSRGDIDELCDVGNTTIEHVTNYNGVTDLNGILFTSVHNGNTLFLPFGEQSGDNEEIYLDSADYWASNTDYNDVETTTGSLYLDLTYIHGEEPVGNAVFSSMPVDYYGGLYRAVKTSSGETKNTRHSIGIGTSDSNRMNAVEVMDNGDTYVYGIGGYDGTNPDVASTLQETIDEKQSILVPGDNITITSANTINANGYIYDNVKGSFSTDPVSFGGDTYTNTNTGYNALCTGQDNTVSGEASAIIGGQNINVTGEVSVGIGGYNNTISAGYSAICAGQANTISSGASNSFIAGRNNTVSGFASATIGRYNDATNQYCVVIGSGSQSMHNIASGDSAINIGRYNSVAGNGSVAIGGGLQTKNTDEVGLGVWNVSHSGNTNYATTVLSFGTGANNSRKNSLEITKSGDVYVEGLGNYTGVAVGGTPSSSVQPIQYVINNKQDVFTTGKGLNMSNNNLITYDVASKTLLVKSSSIPFNNGSVRTISWEIPNIGEYTFTIDFMRLGSNYAVQTGGTDSDPIYELRAFTEATWIGHNLAGSTVTIKFMDYYKNTTGVATPITINPDEYVIIQASYYWNWDLGKGSYTDTGYWIITNIKTFS